MRCPNCQAEIPEDSLFCGLCGNRVVPLNELLEGPTLTMPVAAEPFPPGATFAGRYRIIEALGEGGMGRVYKVFDTQLKEKLALKMIRPEIAANRRTIERFQNELKFARRISHKNVCRMYDLSKENETYFITMESVEGESLGDALRTAKKMTWPSAVRFARQVCEGMAEAHRLGVVHRDLKPYNILIDSDGNVRIMDFGTARSLRMEEGTRARVVIGTSEYMSPEQTEGKEADPRSDIYSLGVILYEMVTGRRPFEGGSAMEIMVKHRNETPVSPRSLSPEIPGALDRLILKCLAKEKEDRYQTAGELGLDLERLETGVDGTAGGTGKRKTSPPRVVTVTFRPRRLILPAILLLAAIAAAFFIWKSMPAKAPSRPADIITIAVVPFANQTGDSSYDYLQETIPNLLINSLEQSESIRVMSWERLFDLLKRLNRPDVRRIDADLGFELCRLDGVDLIVLGSYVKAGDMFATDIKIHDVRSKRLIKSSSARGRGVESILKRQIDALSGEITRRLVEAEVTTSVSATPISEVTTTSLDAYGHFLRGRAAFERLDLPEARAEFERAVEIDPAFPLAYIYLARVHAFMGNPNAVADNLDQFKKHPGKIAGKESLYLEALRARYIDFDLDRYFTVMQRVAADYPNDKRAPIELADYYQLRNQTREAIAEYEKALKIDPEFGYAVNLLAYAHLIRGEFEEAVEYFQKCIRLSPGEANPHDSLAEAYFFWGKYDRAVEKYKDALKVKPDFGAEFRIGYCYAVQENYAEALNWTDRFISITPSNSEKARGYLLKGCYFQLLGRVGEAFREWDAAEALLRSVNDEYNINMVQRIRLWACFDWGLYDEFWKTARARVAYRIEKKLDSEALNRSFLEFYRGFYDLKLGRVGAAAERLAGMKSAFSGTAGEREKALFDQACAHLSSEVLLAQGNFEEALSEFRRTPRGPIGLQNINTLTAGNFPFRDDFPARVLASKGDVDGAIAEYERIIISIHIGGRLVHPFARHRLAGLAERKGLTAEALAQYRKLAGIWNDADPDLEIVRSMRASLTALKTR